MIRQIENAISNMLWIIVNNKYGIDIQLNE